MKIVQIKWLNNYYYYWQFKNTDQHYKTYSMSTEYIMYQMVLIAERSILHKRVCHA